MNRWSIIVSVMILSILTCSCMEQNVDKELLPTVRPTEIPKIDKENQWMLNTNVKIVTIIPEGFVHLNEYLDKYKDIMQWYSFESAIGLSDVDSIVLLQTQWNDSSFIVECDNQYYVNGDAMEKVTKKAEKSYEDRQKIYVLGDEIKIYQGTDINEHNFIIGFVVDSATYSDIPNEADSVFLTIKLTIEHQKYGAILPLNEYIDHVETTTGNVYNESSLDENGEVMIKVPKDEKVKFIFLTGHGFSIVRKVQISD